MRSFKVGRNTYTLVDDEDFDLLKYTGTWHLSQYNRPYSKTLGSLSRFLIEAKENEIVDHIDHNPLNNQKSNLRLVTSQQNSWNAKVRFGVKYKGVKKFPNGKYKAIVRVNSKTLYFGNYDTDFQAAMRYNQEIVKFRGEFAYLNKISNQDGRRTDVLRSVKKES